LEWSQKNRGLSAKSKKGGTPRKKKKNKRGSRGRKKARDPVRRAENTARGGGDNSRFRWNGMAAENRFSTASESRGRNGRAGMGALSLLVLRNKGAKSTEGLLD